MTHTSLTYGVVASFVHRHDDEMAAAKSSRRPGRPPSTKEDLLGLKMLELEKEYKAGFCLCHFHRDKKNMPISSMSPD